MRVAIGGIYHESNTFVTEPTTLANLAEGHLHRGPELVGHWRGTESEVGGFLAGAEEFGFEVIPTLMAWCTPSGTVVPEAYEKLVSELIAGLRAALPLDGILLSLHGAMVSERFPDADGEILSRVRQTVGVHVPVVVTIDFHANVSSTMVSSCDALIGYDTYPHIDQHERGAEAALVLNAILSSNRRPSMHLAQRRMLPHILRQPTGFEPMSRLITRAHEWEQCPGVISATVCAGFPYADVPDAGLSVVVVSDSDNPEARRAAEEIADLAWNRRSEFVASLPCPAEAVRCAVSRTAGLTILADVSDNLGAGTPGDGTVLLEELLQQNARDSLVLLHDPEAVSAAISAGVRTTLRIPVGGKRDTHHGPPVVVEGVVRTISDGIFRNIGPMREGLLEDQGRTAVIDTGGVLVVLTERRMPMWNLQQLRAIGIEPTRLRTIVVKGAIAHRAAYAPIATQIVEVDTPGLAAADVRRLPYQRVKRPIFPLDHL